MTRRGGGVAVPGLHPDPAAVPAIRPSAEHTRAIARDEPTRPAVPCSAARAAEVQAGAARTYGDVLAAEPVQPFDSRRERRAAERLARQEWEVERRFRAAVEPRAAAQLDTPRISFPEKGQLGTSCSIDGADVELGRVLADDVGAHVFRHEVAKYLEPHWPRRAHALVSCGEAGARCDCGDCGTAHVLPYRCGARSCPTCAHVASAVACEKVATRSEHALAALNMADTWDAPGKARAKAWKLLTLTTTAKATAAERYEPATLRAYVKEVRRAVGLFWRATRWGRRVNDVSASGRATKRARRDTLYAVGIEVAPGGMVHVHLAVYGEFIPTIELRETWTTVCAVGGFVNVKAMRTSDAGGFRDALREVLKYVSKGDKEPGKRAERAAVVEYALRRIRRVELGGALRMVPAVSALDVATNARKCETCGGGASWTWRGMRAPDYVRRNQGFGVSHIVDDTDAEQRARRDRAATRAANAEAVAIERAQAHHYRPGGKFYGGTAPPWMDDADEWETIEDRAPLAWLTDDEPGAPSSWARGG